MDSKKMGVVIAVAIIAGGGGFWGGTKYQQTSSPSQNTRAGQAGNFGPGGRTGRGGNGNVFGTILKMDANSLTIQLGGGPGAASSTAIGTKIVLFSGATEIGKTVAGTTSDLAVGQNVSVSGTPNADGSVTAQMVQIRPAQQNRQR